MKSIKISVLTEKQVSAVFNLEDIVEQFNILPISERLPFLQRIFEGITETDIRYLPYSVGMTLQLLMEQKIQMIKKK